MPSFNWPNQIVPSGLETAQWFAFWGGFFLFCFCLFFFSENLLKQLLNKGKQLTVLFFHQSMEKYSHLPFRELKGKEGKAMLNI